ncbi:non-ribosomal peptide synthetase [Actinomadura verrucosospora]|uniref:Long-chain-fatty-acid--CoA ligase n=1 Tax=Actinomadura verrucosospora TaxID=46165 RepID=A0A7D3VQK0_ACTVE|nr:non-ribosomal peptide synthetase [Actinomadura verrucosospora]QKG19890.1 long-chain-fatty-acid--CoA ligase [Actinomadura verrucosospora]
MTESTAQRRALLAALQASRSSGPAAADSRRTGGEPVLHRTDEGPPPLSYAQRRLWFMQQLRPDGVAYSAPIVHRIRGPLDLAALTAALRTVIERHEPLRTTFPEVDGEPVQRVGAPAEPVLTAESVESLPAGEREQAAQALLREHVARPFDLVAGPILRCVSIRLDAAEHILLLNLHHITSDAWSMGVFVRELAECYTAHREGRAPDLPDLPVTYADYTLWQRERLSGDGLRERLAYWEERLADLPVLDLPTDRPRGAVQDGAGATTSLWLPGDLLPGVRDLARSERTSPFVTFLAAFTALLARYTGEHDVAVGTSVAGREADEVAGLIGFFVNTLVLRTDTSGDPTFRELLGRVRETVRSAHEHQDLPFDLLVEHLRPNRDPSRPPLASVLFQQDNTPDCALRLPGLDVELADFDPGTAKYDLLLSVRAWEHGVRVHGQFDTGLFDRGTIRRLLSGYRALVTAAIADPDTPIGRLPVQEPRDEERLVVEWNRTDTPLNHEQCLHELFERQAARRPDAAAVLAGRDRHTFGEIDRRANRLARHLADLGVGPDARVALCLPRGADQLVASLAVLKAGGAFVPVDPDYPADRIAYILGDCEAAAIVSTERLAADLPTGGTPVVRLDADAAEIRGRLAAPPPSAAGPGDLCYVIYTSGSTGTPKGIALRHRGVVNNLLDLNTRFGVGPGDRVLALSSPSFDMSVYELLGVPGAGGAVVLPDPDSLRDPAHWLRLADEHAVTVWNSAPALLTLLLDQVEAGGVPRPGSLRLALLGGDWIPVTLPDRLRAAAGDVRVIALGGATESSIHSTIHEVGTVDPALPSIPYGRPMANQQVYVLDDRLRPVPVGVPGELFLGGVGLARGYLGAAAAGNDRFLEWRWRDAPPRRIYRTGDIARWRADGELELLGRADSQVKLHGLRIELGEIESVLRALPQVRAAVAAVRPDASGERRLVGYAVPEPGAEVTAEELRDAAAAALPGYMVPAAFRILDELPLSPNGKVDRRALPEPETPAGAGEPPRGGTERRVAAVWASVLGVPEIGRDDDFFASGGDSFKAIRAVREIDPGLPVVELFKNPTVAALAARLDAGSTEQGGSLHLLGPSAGTPRLALVCVPYGGGNAVAYRPLADAMPPDVALWAVDLPGHDLADDRPCAPIAETAARCAHEIADRVTGPVAVYGQCAGAATTVELARRLEDIGVPVVATFIGASLPPEDPRRAERRLAEGTLDQILEHLRRLGGFDGALDDEDVTGILRVVQHDLAESVRFFLREERLPPRPLRGPLHCLVGDRDPATTDHAAGHRRWEPYAGEVTLSVIPDGDHYFCKHRPHAVAAVVMDLLAATAAEAA